MNKNTSQSGWMRRQAPRAHTVHEVLMVESTKSNLHWLYDGELPTAPLRIDARLNTNSVWSREQWDNRSKKQSRERAIRLMHLRTPEVPKWQFNAFFLALCNLLISAPRATQCSPHVRREKKIAPRQRLHCELAKFIQILKAHGSVNHNSIYRKAIHKK